MFEIMALDSDSFITLHNISHLFLKELKLSVDLCSYFVLISLEFQWLGIAFFLKNHINCKISVCVADTSIKKVH